MASKTRMLSPNPTTSAFGRSLDQHLIDGTRPSGTPDSKGVPWQNKEFAKAVGEHSSEGPKSERTIRNWRNGETLPSPADLEGILQALFGGKPHYVDVRADLTDKYHRDRDRGEVTREPDAPRSSLPTKPLRCLGRDDDLRSVIEALLAQRDDTAVLVLGGPGMGKTTVTRQAAVDPTVVEKFGQRRWFVELETAANAEAIEKATTIALGLDPASAGFDSALARLGLAPGLLVFDNLETPWDGEREKVEALLTALHRVLGLALLASIRGNDSPAGVRWTRRRTMHQLESPYDREMFLDIATDVKANDPDLDPLLALLGGVPIAIELVAQLAAPHDSLHAIRTEWDRVGSALATRRGMDPSRLTSLEVSLELSFQSARLGVSGRRLFAILGQLPAGIAPDDLDALLGTTAFDARQGLLASGLGFERGGRLDLLPPIRDHARRLHPPPNADSPLWRDHYLALAGASSDQMGTRDGAAAVHRIATELPNLDAAIRAAISADALLVTADAISGIMNAMAATGLGTTAALRELAYACHAAGDIAGEARTIDAMGYVAFCRSDYAAARKAYEEALPLYRRAGVIQGEANCIQGLGDLALRRFDHAAANKAHDEALLLYRKVGDFLGEANCIQKLGEIALQRSDHETAQRAYEQALPLHRQIGSVLGEATSIACLGEIAFARSDHGAARKAYNEALPLFGEVGDILGKANCIQRLGDIALAHSDHEAAPKAYKQALPFYRQVGNIRGEANCIKALGDIALARSDHEAARTGYERALGLYQRIEEPYSIGATHLALASVTEGAERDAHRAGARKAWLSIGREDLVKKADLSE
jgi:tetratricopeptide (TPR) repeat protein